VEPSVNTGYRKTTPITNKSALQRKQQSPANYPI